MSKRSTIGSNPLDSVIPGSRHTPKTSPKPFSAPLAKSTMSRITFLWPLPLIEKLRNTVYWTPGSSMADFLDLKTTLPLAGCTTLRITGRDR